MFGSAGTWPTSTSVSHQVGRATQVLPRVPAFPGVPEAKGRSVRTSASETSRGTAKARSARPSPIWGSRAALGPAVPASGSTLGKLRRCPHRSVWQSAYRTGQAGSPKSADGRFVVDLGSGVPDGEWQGVPTQGGEDTHSGQTYEDDQHDGERVTHHGLVNSAVPLTGSHSVSAQSPWLGLDSGDAGRHYVPAQGDDWDAESHEVNGQALVAGSNLPGQGHFNTDELALHCNEPQEDSEAADHVPAQVADGGNFAEEMAHHFPVSEQAASFTGLGPDSLDQACGDGQVLLNGHALRESQETPSSMPREAAEVVAQGSNEPAGPSEQEDLAAEVERLRRQLSQSEAGRTAAERRLSMLKDQLDILRASEEFWRKVAQTERRADQERWQRLADMERRGLEQAEKALVEEGREEEAAEEATPPKKWPPAWWPGQSTAELVEGPGAVDQSPSGQPASKPRSRSPSPAPPRDSFLIKAMGVGVHAREAMTKQIASFQPHPAAEVDTSSSPVGKSPAGKPTPDPRLQSPSNPNGYLDKAVDATVHPAQAAALDIVSLEAHPAAEVDGKINASAIGSRELQPVPPESAATPAASLAQEAAGEATSVPDKLEAHFAKSKLRHMDKEFPEIVMKKLRDMQMVATQAAGDLLAAEQPTADVLLGDGNAEPQKLLPALMLSEGIDGELEYTLFLQRWLLGDPRALALAPAYADAWLRRASSAAEGTTEGKKRDGSGHSAVACAQTGPLPGRGGPLGGLPPSYVPPGRRAYPGTAPSGIHAAGPPLLVDLVGSTNWGWSGSDEGSTTDEGSEAGEGSLGKPCVFNPDEEELLITTGLAEDVRQHVSVGWARSEEDADAAPEGAARPGWNYEGPTADLHPLSGKDYIDLLENIKGLIETGEVDQLDAVAWLDSYFAELKVGRRAWRTPNLAITKPPPKRMFPPASREKVDGVWQNLSRSASFCRSGQRPVTVVTKVVVFGGGAFATALAVCAARAHPNADVVMLLRKEDARDDINLRNMNNKYIPGAELEKNIRAVIKEDEGGNAYANALAGADFAVHAIPVQESRNFLESIKDILPETTPIIAASKGLESKRVMLMSELIPDALDRKQPAVFISGPSFASEIVLGQRTTLVAASSDRRLAERAQNLLSTDEVIFTVTDDVIGVEICGALKNVLAIAMGIVRGQEMGENAFAAVFSFGMREIFNLVQAAGGKAETVLGPAGIGDAVLTAFGAASRNTRVGIKLGSGMTIEDVMTKGGPTAEGVKTAVECIELANKYGCPLPVLTGAAQVITGAWTAREAVRQLEQLLHVAGSSPANFLAGFKRKQASKAKAGPEAKAALKAPVRAAAAVAV